MRCCHSVFVERYSVAYCMPALWDALVSTWMGDRLGIPGAVSLSILHLLPPCALFGRTRPLLVLLAATPL